MATAPSRRTFVVILASALASLSAHAAEASGPIRLIIPTPPGSASDALARAISGPWGKQSGRSVVVENVAGAGSLIGTAQLARAPKDGLTIGVITSNHTIIPWLFKNLAFDAVADFTPIAMLGSVPMMLVASSHVPATTLAELVQLAKSRSASLAEGLVTGSVYQIASEVFKEQAGINTNRIFYKGSAQITNDLLAAILDVGFVSAQGAAPHIAAGKLKGLAVTSPARTEIVPQIPTLVEAGFPRFNVDAWLAIAGPAGMPAEGVAARRKEVELALADPDMKKALQLQGIQVRKMAQTDMLPFLREELERNRQVVQRIGIKID